jgi:Type-F conjugative transfer system protein (TrbI_Ftype)
MSTLGGSNPGKTDGSGIVATDTRSPPRELSAASFRFAGFSAARLAFFILCVAALCWGMWVTRQLTKPSADDLVSVRLSKLVGDFVTSQARSNVPEDVAAIQTAMYMKSLDTALKERSARGATILVAEAVIASSARDVTEEVRAETAARMASLFPQGAGAPISSNALGPAPASNLAGMASGAAK